MGLGNTLKRAVAWWSEPSWGTALFTRRNGERVGEDNEGNVFYQADGGKRRWVIYNGDNEASRISPEWHGWLHYTWDQPPTEAPPQAFGGLRPEAQRQATEFANRLRSRARHLRRWPTKRGITCYRLYERDIPEAPLVVDRYEDALHEEHRDMSLADCVGELTAEKISSQTGFVGG